MSDQLKKEKVQREKVAEKRKEVEKLKVILEGAKKEAKLQSEVTDKLLIEANDRLKKNYLKEAKVAQSIIDVAMFSKVGFRCKGKGSTLLAGKNRKEKGHSARSFFSF